VDEEVDVVVLGMGPAGEDVAGRLAGAGLDVVGIEHGLVGGECPYWGCVPTKLMVRAGDALAEAGRATALAGCHPSPGRWAPVADRVAGATDGWDDSSAVKRFGQQGGRLRRGTGRLVGPGRVEVDGVVLRAGLAVVVATGARPVVPDVPGLAGTPYWTNRGAVESGDLPESLVVLGGGAVGAELAQVFRRFGTAVTVVESGPRLLGGEEPEAGDVVARVFADEGIDVRTATEVTSAYHDGGRFTLLLGGGESLAAERVLVAAGRRPDLEALGVASLGLDPAVDRIAVDGRQRVAGAPRTWAVGDLTGEGAYTHVALAQADTAVRDILGEDLPPSGTRTLPRVTFTDPEVGAVGMTERVARDSVGHVRVGTVDLADEARGWIHGTGTPGFVKVVEDARRGVLVGATAVGPCGGEVVGLLTLAVHAGVPVVRLLDMVYAYPTFHRAVRAAVRDLDV
jgi:pyruvate/2-oxoglutarate dehydrogenase complex dihydrolipoamide dehydrogenase (E3) component